MAIEKPNPTQLAKFIKETTEEWSSLFNEEEIRLAVARAVILRYMTPEMNTFSNKPDAVRAREYKKRKKEGLVQS